MSIARFEDVAVYNLTFSKSDFGEQATTQTEWFKTRARVEDVANNVKISDKYRMYQDLVNFTFNYTPNTKQIVNRQDLYSIFWRGNYYRITDVRETNNRMNVKMMCYRSDPVTAV